MLSILKYTKLFVKGGKYSNVVIELLSNSTARVDKGAKKTLYQDVWRLLEITGFYPETLEFAGFRLVNGGYEAIAPTERDACPVSNWDYRLEIHER
jgi:Uma2 family endonuclease